MTTKEFRNHLDVITKGIHNSVKAYNEKNYTMAMESERDTKIQIQNLLAYFDVTKEALEACASFTIHRAVSFKSSTTENGEATKEFHVSDGTIRSYIKKELLDKYVPQWEDKLEKKQSVGKLSKMSEEELQKKQEELQKKTEAILAEIEYRKKLQTVSVNGNF